MGLWKKIIGEEDFEAEKRREAKRGKNKHRKAARHKAPKPVKKMKGFFS